jgi:hypothetical protein
MKKAKACYADGGVVGSDGLTDAQRAKRNAALNSLGMGSATASPAPQPAQVAPQSAPVQQNKGGITGIADILGNRNKVIDKAAGYACGGKVKAHANGGVIRGAGTPTSDSIPAKVRETGEGIRVSTDERIVSKAQDNLLQLISKGLGFDDLDSMLEAGTGKPVGPTIKGGSVAAADGLAPWYEKDPLTAISKNMDSSKAAEAYQKSLYPKGTFDAPQTAPSVAAPVAQNQPINPSGVAQKITDIAVPGTQFMTGATPGAIPDSSGGGFVSGNRAYNVNDTSEQGIQRVTSKGTSPLYTNIKPETAVATLGNQMIGQPAAEAATGLERMANANKIRGEMIAGMQEQGGPASGISILQTDQTLPGGMSVSDWNNRVSAGFNTQMSPKQKAEYLSTEGSQGIQRESQDVLRRGQDMQSNQAAGHDKVIMRGQDISALSDKAKLAMLERNDQRQGDKFGLESRIMQGQLADSETQRAARGKLSQALASGDPAAITKARTEAVAAGLKFDREDNGMKPVEIADPADKLGMRKILVQPNADGTYTPMQARQAPAQQRTYADFEKAYLAKRPGSTPEQMKADYQQLYGAK